MTIVPTKMEMALRIHITEMINAFRFFLMNVITKNKDDGIWGNKRQMFSEIKESNEHISTGWAIESIKYKIGQFST